MSAIVNNVCCGNCLNFPYVKPALAIGLSSVFMSASLEYMGFDRGTNPVTASFSVAAVEGLGLATISTVAFSVISHLIYLGNQRAMHEFD